MMISKTQIEQVMKQYKNNTRIHKQEKPGAVATLRRADEVTLSQAALDAQQVQNRLKDIPEVRQAKILDLQERIQSGTYNVSGEDIAGQIIGRNIVDRML